MSQILSDLLREAGRVHPGAVFARIAGDGDNALSLAEIDALADHYAGRWGETGLPEGGCVLQLGAPEPRALASAFGALRAGFRVALAAAALDAGALAAIAEASRAVALAGPGDLAGLAIGERLFEAAALSPGVRLVALHGADKIGALALDAPRDGETTAAAAADQVDFFDANARRLSLSNDDALAAALDYASKAGVARGGAVVSLLSPAAHAGWICGVLAPLASGARTIWQAPFNSLSLLDVLDNSGLTHLVAPAGVAGELRAAGIFAAERLASLTLIAAADAALPDLPRRHAHARILVMRVSPDGRPRLDFADPDETTAAKFG